MKKFIILSAIVYMGASVAQAQLLDANVGAGVKANVGVEAIKASTTVNVNANVNSTIKKDGASTTSSTTVKGNSTSSVATSKDNDNKATTTASSVVSLSARDIRDWSDADKSDFLLTVKSHAELQSGQDLENFAKGVIVTDTNVDTVVADDTHVEVSYKLPARFLGVFATEIDALADVSFEQKENGNGPKEVTVKFPWYKMFYSLDSEARADVLESAIEASVSSDTSSTSVNVASRNGKTIQLISSILKSIRASIESSAEVSVE